LHISGHAQSAPKTRAQGRDAPQPKWQASARQELPVNNAVYRIALAHLISNVVALSIGLMLLASILFVLLRRFGPFLDALRRVQFIGAPGSGQSELLPPSSEAEDTRGPSRAESFDLGLTYPEEMRLREQALQQQEEAMVRHIYEQNMQLREQIGQLETAQV
jgi:hypothetical protein